MIERVIEPCNLLSTCNLDASRLPLFLTLFVAGFSSPCRRLVLLRQADLGIWTSNHRFIDRWGRSTVLVESRAKVEQGHRGDHHPAIHWTGRFSFLFCFVVVVLLPLLHEEGKVKNNECEHYRFDSKRASEERTTAFWLLPRPPAAGIHAECMNDEWMWRLVSFDSATAIFSTNQPIHSSIHLLGNIDFTSGRLQCYTSGERAPRKRERKRILVNMRFWTRNTRARGFSSWQLDWFPL